VTSDDSIRPHSAAASNPALEDGRLAVPDFIGLSLRAALIKARTLNMPVEIRGHGYVVKQSPGVGTAWQTGNKIILNLQG
jgi:hypothetical protein